MQVKIRTNYRGSSDSSLLQLGNRVAASMKANPNFPNPKPEQSVLETACQELTVAMNAAGRKDQLLSSAKNDKRAALISLLDELANYVTVTSNGDRTLLLSSGFDIAGLKREIKTLPPVTGFSVEVITPGQATTRVRRINGARSYVHQYTPDPITSDSVWTGETVTDRQFTFTNLKSVTKYWFRVIAVGRGRQSVASPPVSRVVQ